MQNSYAVRLRRRRNRLRIRGHCRGGGGRARRLPRPRSGEERICRRHDDGRPAYLGYLDVQKRPTVGGIATEFVERLRQDNASFGVRYCPKHCSIAAIDPDRVKLTAAKFLEDSGVDFLLHTHAIAVEVEDGVLRSIRCECAGTRIQVRAKVFIDAIGDGVISYLAGAEYEKGTAGVDLQPPSILFTIGGVNKERFFGWLEEHPEEVEPYTMEYLRAAPDFVLVTLQKLWENSTPSASGHGDLGDDLYQSLQRLRSVHQRPAHGGDRRDRPAEHNRRGDTRPAPGGRVY